MFQYQMSTTWTQDDVLHPNNRSNIVKLSSAAHRNVDIHNLASAWHYQRAGREQLWSFPPNRQAATIRLLDLPSLVWPPGASETA
ncbi:hypothetical protein Purlil1_12093 [Purpureocillium lilacinum]|uniref:Uncharacterized protein n=1 Tax=Purpureocillium lilacinum TaxID=33203 RepID=A0ABR0BI18_PURLI|nr:hypothetical protein Purlil1_12093 [Purpureocillium lilacinum]